nr:unnamed protein product [Spirometra erinaceieuropaei]
MLGIRTALKPDSECSAAELVYGTALRILGDFFEYPQSSVDLDPSDYVQRLRQAMTHLRTPPPRAPTTVVERELKNLKEAKSSGPDNIPAKFLNRSDSLEEQISLYERAANCFKMAHKWSEAGDAFCQAAKLSSSNKSAHDAANNYVNASVAYRKTDPKTAIDCLNKATEIYIESGRFSIAARHHMTMAEIYEQDLGDVEQTCKQYEQAADYYKGEESNSSAMKCLLKVAHFAASAGKYDKAAKIFEEAGKSSMDNKLLRYGAKEHLTKSKISEALNQESVEGFTAAVAEYDSITRLEPWTTEMLLKLKKTIADEEDIT